MNSIYPIVIQKANKSETTLGEFQGQVLLIVNVASKCGLTPQYDGLERIYEKYASRGFTVLGFPANEFGAQEPGTNEQIQEFCRLNFSVKFPVFAKIIVKGPDQHPLYQYLTRQFPKASVKGSSVLKFIRKIVHSDSFTGEVGEIAWNFEKFLVNRKGEVVARFPPDTVPEDAWITDAIESLLAET